MTQQVSVKDRLDQCVGQPTRLPRRCGLPAWLVSLTVHLLVLLLLGSITRATGYFEQETFLSTEVMRPVSEEFKFDTAAVKMLGNDSQLNTLSPSQAFATDVGSQTEQRIEARLENKVLPEAVVPVLEVAEPSEANLLEVVQTTGGTEHPGGVEGAMDRLTYEIAASLRERKTLVIWLFDASLSLKERRDAIAERFENVYRQLGQLDVGVEEALKTAAATFGANTNMLTSAPVDDVRTVVAAVRNIEPDLSGRENVFTAVADVTNRWKSYRTKEGRNVMVVVVTDERGDDFTKMEEVIHRTRRLGIRVYCVGNAALFGREKGYVPWQFEDGTTEMLPVDQGPETAALERLRLAFWGSAGQSAEQLSASFGPYALTRLCAETGGLYLVTKESESRFDPEIMKNYLPDYRPVTRYQADLAKNLSKGALVRAAMTTQAHEVPPPRLRFRADTLEVLRRQLTEAQKPLALLDYFLNEMHTILDEGQKDRARLKSPRWRASFDLALGRVLAMRVRAYGYNVVLAEMKGSPKRFSRKESNQWRLVASNKTDLYPPGVKKMARQAEEILNRVIEDHPGTPWAHVAELELSQPLGWEWQEATMFIAPPNPNRNQPRRVQLAEEQRRRQQRRQQSQPRPKPSL